MAQAVINSWHVRRFPWQATAQLALLFTAVVAFVFGLGKVVHGAQISVFLPVGALAVLIGWLCAQSTFGTLQVFSSLILMGPIFLWGWTARLGQALAQLALSLPVVGFYIQDGFIPQKAQATGEVLAALQTISGQSAALWLRMQAWLAGVSSGTVTSDPVASILVWSFLLWILAVWAGWAAARNKVLAGMSPLLAVLAVVTNYSNADISAVWLMAASTLGLMSLIHLNANLRRWELARLDYAELITSNTILIALPVVLGVVILGWVLPQVSIKDIFESWRTHSVAENPAASSLGLEKTAPQPVSPAPSPFERVRPSALPNQLLLGSGPELSRQVVFTVQTGELPAQPAAGSLVQNAPRHYWRSFSFDQYTGSGWVSSNYESLKYTAGQELFAAPTGYSLLNQSFHLLGGQAGSMLWSGILYRSDAPFEAAWRKLPLKDNSLAGDPIGNIDLYGALNATSTYQVESLLLQVSVEQLRKAPRETPDLIRQRYTALPSSVPERVYALARDLTSAHASAYDEAAAIETYLRANYVYSLNLPMPPSGLDVADYFLFELKRGYCDYYATAMVVLARAIGLPARLVTGYASGSYDASAAEYIVSAADAHSWPEIYFSGIGWVEFEPTAGQPEIIRAARQIELSAPQMGTSESHRWGEFFGQATALSAILRWSFFGIAGLVGLAGLFFLLEGLILGLVRPRFALRWMLRSIFRQGSRLAGVSTPSETASEFACQLQSVFQKSDPRLDLLTGYYLRSLFASMPPEKNEIRRAIRAWYGLRWKLFWSWKKRKA